MKTVLGIIALVATAGLANAGVLSSGSNTQTFKGESIGGVNAPAGSFSERADIVVDLSGRQSWDAFGDTDNNVILFDVAAALGLPSGSAVSVTGIGWNVTITTTPAGPFGGSWLEEARFTLGSVATPNLIGVLPGFGVGAPGTQTFTNPVIDFASVPLPDISLADGILRIELNETFDDSNGEVDANYLAGSNITIRAIPTPGALALAGLGGLVAARRRRA